MRIKIFFNHRSFRELVLLGVMLVFPNMVFCQYQDNIHRLIYSNSGGEKGFTTYIYNGKGFPYKAIWELEDGSRWSVNSHKFDDKGNMVKKHRDFSDSIKIDQEFFYDEQNNLIKEIFYRSDGLKGLVHYIYNNGKLRIADCKGLNGWFFGKIVYKYDHNSEMASSAILITDIDTVGSIDLKYNLQDKLIEETWTFNTGFSQTFIYEYIDTDNIHYKSSNIFIRDNYPWIIVEENYDFSGQGGGPSFYNYDEDGKLLEKIFVRSDGLKTLTNYFYRDCGHLEKSVRHYSDGLTGTFTYSYNKDGNTQTYKFKYRRID